MGWSQLPGIDPDRRVRSLVVGSGYLIAVPVALVLLPVLVVGAVATNYRGVASRLSQLPGISPDGGLKAGLVAGGGLFVLWGVVLVGQPTAASAVSSALARLRTSTQMSRQPTRSTQMLTERSQPAKSSSSTRRRWIAAESTSSAPSQPATSSRLSTSAAQRQKPNSSSTRLRHGSLRRRSR